MAQRTAALATQAAHFHTEELLAEAKRRIEAHLEIRLVEDISTEDLVAFLDAVVEDTLRCQSTRSAHGCRRGARWLVSVHGCLEVPVCTQHRNLWLREVATLAAKSKSGHIGCIKCYRKFGVEAYTKVRPL